jgi:glycosyltransferase involved in cell wall biosynthesis
MVPFGFNAADAGPPAGCASVPTIPIVMIAPQQHPQDVTGSQFARARRAHSICLICSGYPPNIGGTEIEIQRVCSLLRARGHHAEVLTVGGQPMPPYSRWTDPFGTPVRLFGRLWPQQLRHYAYAAGAALHLLKNSGKYDIVYLVMGGIQLATALPVARLLRKPVIMKFSGSNTILPLTESRLGRFELQLLRRWAARILVLNPAMEQEALRAGLSKEQIGWMPNPVDTGEFRPAAEERKAALRRLNGFPERDPMIVFVGRLAPEKQLPSLLEAFSIVVHRHSGARLALVGDGPLRPELAALAEQLGIAGNVRFAGAVPPDAVKSWLQAADIFTLVSSVEGFPCSLIEAMACGIPAVVSDISGNRQLIEDRVHGLVAPVADHRAIAQALLRLIEDPRLRAALGAAGREQVVQKYSAANVMVKYERLFDSVASGATAAPFEAQPGSSSGSE